MEHIMQPEISDKKIIHKNKDPEHYNDHKKNCLKVSEKPKSCCINTKASTVEPNKGRTLKFNAGQRQKYLKAKN